jgi:hypothetical protein
VTLAVTGNTISDRVVQRKRMPVFEWHRLALTGCRLHLRWLSGRGGRRLYMCFMYLVFRLWKRVVTNALKGTTTSSQVARRQRLSGL